MLNITEFVAVLDTIKIPHVYFSFPENGAPALPYFVYYFSGSDNIGADDAAYVEVLTPVIELYTAQKSFSDERTIETALNAAGLFWNKTEEYITAEEMYMVTYELTGVNNAEQS